jgi:hypothetical protein
MAKKKSLDKLLTAGEAADQLGCHPSMIRRFCRGGRLGQWLYGRWLIGARELREFDQKRQHGPGRPKVAP